MPVNSFADYRAQMAKLKPGQDVLFKIARHQSDRVANFIPRRHRSGLSIEISGSAPAYAVGDS